LYYLRDRVGKRARVRELRVSRARVAPRVDGAASAADIESETLTEEPELVEQPASEGGEG
jgi:hypothetical protein